MARSKQFNVDEALDNAMVLFWQQGYERTSLNDLLGAMGIGRASFYNAFDDKHTLFMRILKRYQQQYNQVVILDTLAGQSNLIGIHAVFAKVIDGLAGDPDKKGCLIVNSASDIAPHDAQVAQYLQGIAQTSENAFYDALRNAQAQDELGADHDCRALARFLMTTIRGMRMTGRITCERHIYDDITRIALSTLTA